MLKSIAVLALLLGSQAYALGTYDCEEKAAAYITQKYNETVTDARQIGDGDSGREGDVEVTVSTARGGSYSVFMPAPDCPFVKRDVRWK